MDYVRLIGSPEITGRIKLNVPFGYWAHGETSRAGASVVEHLVPTSFRLDPVAHSFRMHRPFNVSAHLHKIE